MLNGTNIDSWIVAQIITHFRPLFSGFEKYAPDASIVIQAFTKWVGKPK